MAPRTFSVLLLLAIGLSASAQLTLNISVPENTPLLDTIHVAGDFNAWDPSDQSMVLSAQPNGTFQIGISPLAGNVAFKFTRGNWPSVEADAFGVDIADRNVFYSGGSQTEYLNVESWIDVGPPTGTMGQNVSVLDNDLPIPQLGRQRRIWIYLPPDYHSTNNYYPVLYMQDGQNLFDINTSFSGEWEVDETMDDLFAQGDLGAIVIGIDNGEQHRIDEYSPWVNPTYGGGEGAQYVDFIIQTLKPLVDMNFRTLPQREHTAILGSSMGGLIAMYAGIEHQEVFGKIAAMSPSFWFSGDVYSHVQTTGKQHDMRILLLGGEMESATMIPNLNAMMTELSNAGFQPYETTLMTHWDGQHSEWYWKREFGAVYEWLCSGSPVGIEEGPIISANIYPNPTSDRFTITINETIEKSKSVVITDILGRPIFRRQLSISNSRQQAGKQLTLNSSETGPGFFLVHLESEKGQREFLGKLVVQ